MPAAATAMVVLRAGGGDGAAGNESNYESDYESDEEEKAEAGAAGGPPSMSGVAASFAAEAPVASRDHPDYHGRGFRQGK